MDKIKVRDYYETNIIVAEVADGRCTGCLYVSTYTGEARCYGMGHNAPCNGRKSIVIENTPEARREYMLTRARVKLGVKIDG